MYRMQKELYPKNENSSVISGMIWGCQWDNILRWMQSSTDENVRKYVSDSTGKGNYATGNIIATGSNEQYKVNNIYDLAGNVFEWTLEATPDNRRTLRGGSFGTSHFGSTHPVSFRSNSSTPNSKSTNMGSRLQLYIK